LLIWNVLNIRHWCVPVSERLHRQHNSISGRLRNIHEKETFEMRTTDDAGNPYDMLTFSTPDFARLLAAVGEKAALREKGYDEQIHRLRTIRLDGGCGPLAIEVTVPGATPDDPWQSAATSPAPGPDVLRDLLSGRELILKLTIGDDRYPLSPRIGTLRGILATQEGAKPAPVPLPSRRNYASPRHTAAQRRAR
jgi:hypothetical protein